MDPNEDLPSGMAFPFRVDPGTGGVVTSQGPDKLRDNLLFLLQAELGERLLRRDYGAGLRGLVHEPINNPFVGLVKRQIAKAVARFEPRVQIVDLQVGLGAEAGQVEAALIYVVRTTQTTDRLTVTLVPGDASGSGDAP